MQGPATPQTVSGPQISMLVRATMMALDQANRTGNYTVLRDLTASSMREQNSAARLAELFAPFRAEKINLTPTVLVDARLPDGPQLTTDGYLRLKGYFPTEPEQVVFDMGFFYEAGEWRIASVNVGLRQPPAPGTGEREDGQPGAPQSSPPAVPAAEPQVAAPALPKPRPDPAKLDAARAQAAKRLREDPPDAPAADGE